MAKSKTRLRKFEQKRMHDWKHGKMHAGIGIKGRKQKKPVKSQKQAEAIMLSEARKKGLIK